MAIVVSATGHLLLLILFLLIEVTIQPPPAPVAEVSFISGRPGHLSGYETRAESVERSNVTAGTRDDESPAPLSERARADKQRQATRTPAAERSQPSSPVAPPKRRMLEQEEPILTSRGTGKIDASETMPAGDALSARSDGRGRIWLK